MSAITAVVKKVGRSITVLPLEGKWKASLFSLAAHPKFELEEGQLVQIIVPLGGQGAEWASTD